MKELTAADVARLTGEILEKMAFIMLMPMEGEANQDELLHSKISYFGPDEQADLHISASADLLIELASNMLGVDEDEVDASVEGVQALNELANIVCGEVIGALGGEETVFSQGIPETVQSIDPVNEGALRTCSAMESDEGAPVQVIVTRTSCQ